MYEFTCAVCGKVKQVTRRDYVGTYCSRSCAAKAREAKKETVRLKSTGGRCVYNPIGVNCDFLECENCGWNPEVAQARLERIMEGMNERTV